MEIYGWKKNSAEAFMAPFAKTPTLRWPLQAFPTRHALLRVSWLVEKGLPSTKSTTLW